MRTFFICAVLSLGVLFLAYYFVPKPALLSNFTFSSAVEDREGRLLRLTLSRDEKYRLFVPVSKIPEDAKKALMIYEDKNFYHHPGVDPKALTRAAIGMMGGGRRQGASTISMQLARLVYDIDSSSVSGKIMQIARAIQIERHYSKDEILEAYFNLAPYGDNIEGIGAASLIYFGMDVGKLSLPEILSLTVIPQNPAKRNPNKNPAGMNAARRLLTQIWKKEFPTDSKNTYLDLPVYIQGKKQIPFLAPHFSNMVLNKRSGIIRTTLDYVVQRQVEEATADYVHRKNNLGIYNAAVLVIDYKTMETVAYVGSNDFWDADILGQVDGVMAQRSPGSAMKPFIYELAVEQGLIHPLTLLKDLPRSYAFYNPENFDQKYQGAVTATSALVYSLNIPAVDLLQKLKPKSFYSFLEKSGVQNLRSESYYGLALALGGYEVSLMEMVRMYATLANLGMKRTLKVIKDENKEKEERVLTPEGCFLALKMLAYNKPVDNNTTYPVYWKTGTSYSYKDAWSVGIAGRYVVGVWIGNFDGISNHAFVGRTAAAPLFFEIVRLLGKQNDFGKYELSDEGLNVRKVEICRPTGDIANKACPSKVMSWFIPGVSPIKLSNVHREIPVDIATGLRACRHTPPSTKMAVYEFWPSDILRAFEAGGIAKKSPPAFMDGCDRNISVHGKDPEITYPIAHIAYVVRSHKLADEKMMLKAVADADVQRIYWFMDDALLGESAPNEGLEATPIIGEHMIKAVDDKGRVGMRNIRVVLED